MQNELNDRPKTHDERVAESVQSKLKETQEAIAFLKAHKQEVPPEAYEIETLALLAVECLRLREAIWPGLPKWDPTEQEPQQDFYEAVAEALITQNAKDAKLIQEIGKRLTWSRQQLRKAEAETNMKDHLVFKGYVAALMWIFTKVDQDVPNPSECNNELTDDLAMLIRRLVRRVWAIDREDKVANAAHDYLIRNDLQGAIIRAVGQ